MIIGNQMGYKIYEDMRALLGSHLLGHEEITKATTLANGQTLVEWNTLSHCYDRLADKLEEKDIAEFVARLTRRDLDPADFLLAYDLSHFADGAPITMENLHARLEPDMIERKQGKLLYNTTWYRGERFFTDLDPAIRRQEGEWVFVTKAPLPDSFDKALSEQTVEIRKAARRFGLDETRVGHRTPRETAWHHAVALRSHDIRLLEGVFDRSDVSVSDGYLVRVGGGVSDGLRVSSWDPSDSHPNIGAALSR